MFHEDAAENLHRFFMIVVGREGVEERVTNSGFLEGDRDKGPPGPELREELVFIPVRWEKREPMAGVELTVDSRSFQIPVPRT